MHLPGTVVAGGCAFHNRINFQFSGIEAATVWPGGRAIDREGKRSTEGPVSIHIDVVFFIKIGEPSQLRFPASTTASLIIFTDVY